MSNLTKRQQEIIDFILSYRKAYQTLPNRREIQTALGLKHYNAIKSHFDAIFKKGRLRPSTNNVGYEVVDLVSDATTA